jgi:hypothetical protein
MDINFLSTAYRNEYKINFVQNKTSTNPSKQTKERITTTTTTTKATGRVIFFYISFYPFADHKSLLTDTDWKKLWMEAGHLDSQIDNTLDNDDATVVEASEVSARKFVCVWVKTVDNCSNNYFSN